MKYAVKYSTFFFEDLAAITDYLSRYSTTAPTHIKNLLFERIEQLKTTPEMYSIYTFAPKYRHIVIDKYVVIYRIDEENKVIFMYRLLHGARDIKSYL